MNPLKTFPASGEEAPTARAIQERIHKIRALAGGKGIGTFKMVGTVGSRGGGAKPAAGTPKSSPAKPATTPRSNRKAGGKRGRGAGEGFVPL